MNTEHPYWIRQTLDKPSFPDIQWAKPEQKSQAGKLAIIGGNKLGFISVAENYQVAIDAGIGEAKMLLPDILKKSIPNNITNVIYAPTNQSGGLRDALDELIAIGNWSTGSLLIGDTGGNSETAILYEEFVNKYQGPLTITRDAIDILKNATQQLLNRENTLLVVSFAQLQKIFSAVYYPKVLTFSMQLTNLVESLHKFTITYPVAITVFHNDNIVVAFDGKVTSTPCENPMKIWRGNVATRASVYWVWNPNKPLESITTSLLP